MRTRFILIPLLLWSAPSNAGDRCSTIEDLSKDVGPAWDQVDTSWCHVFTTTDAETKHLQNLGVLKPGERLHPLREGVGIAMADRTTVAQSIGQQGTLASDVIKLQQWPNDQTPSCTQYDLDDYSDEANAFFNVHWTFGGSLFSDLKNTTCATQCQRGSREQNALTKLCAGLIQFEREYWVGLFKTNCHVVKPAMNYRYWFGQDRFAEIKAGKIPSRNKKLEQDFAREIDTALKKGEFAAIGYDARFIRKTPGKDSDSHWSSIVGRKRGADGKCYYRVRNSWGSGCQFYNDKANCVNGYLTVAEDDLLKNIHTVQYIMDPGGQQK